MRTIVLKNTPPDRGDYTIVFPSNIVCTGISNNIPPKLISQIESKNLYNHQDNTPRGATLPGKLKKIIIPKRLFKEQIKKISCQDGCSY